MLSTILKINMELKTEIISQQTNDWVEHFVLALNLCPFAHSPFERQSIRYSVCQAQNTEDLLRDLILELQKANSNLDIETTLLIHPQVLQDFADYNDFLTVVDAVLEDMELDGIIQVASFHPNYCFAGEEVGDVSNYTNRSPYPMLHLIREKSINQAVKNYKDVDKIPETNISKLRELGKEELDILIKKILKTN